MVRSCAGASRCCPGPSKSEQLARLGRGPAHGGRSKRSSALGRARTEPPLLGSRRGPDSTTDPPHCAPLAAGRDRGCRDALDRQSGAHQAHGGDRGRGCRSAPRRPAGAPGQADGRPRAAALAGVAAHAAGDAGRPGGLRVRARRPRRGPVGGPPGRAPGDRGAVALVGTGLALAGDREPARRGAATAAGGDEQHRACAADRAQGSRSTW